MTIYDVAIIFTIVLAFMLQPVGFYSSKGVNSACNKYLFLVGCILVLIPGLRDVTIGLDTYQYEDFYRSIRGSLFKAISDTRFEEGFVLINLLTRPFDFIVLQIVVSTLLVGLVFAIIKRYSTNIGLSCVLFIIFCFYYRCFNEMRQAVALGVVCYSLRYMVEKDIKRFLACVLIAALFHRTSIIIAPAALLLYIGNIKWWQISLLLGGLVILTMYANLIIQAFLPYFLTDYSNMEEGAGGWGLFAFQILTLCLAFYRYKYLKVDRTNVILVYLLCVSIIMFPICHINPMLFRLQDYYWVFMIILVPRIINTFRSSFIRSVACSCYFIIGYFFYFVKMFTESNELIPYKFFW